MSQTNYSLTQPIGIQGQLADMGENDVVSRLVQDVGGIRMGLAVVYGTNDDQCKLPSASTDKVLGMVLAEQTHVSSTLAQKDAASILRKGRAYVVTEAACVPGDAVQVRYSANGLNTVAGSFTNTVDAGHTINLPDAQFMSTTAAGGLALVELNLI